MRPKPKAGNAIGLGSFWLWFTVLTLAVRPWRNSLSQDDAVYAKFVQILPEGKIHILNVAGVWTQSLLGVLATAISPLPFIVTLNLLTWVVFGLLVFLIVRRFREQEWVVLTFFSFPLWVQYGASFLPDVYVALILYLIFLVYESEFTRKNIAALCLLSVALVIQYQSFSAFLFFWAISHFRDRKKMFVGLAGLALAFGVFLLLPKSPLQASGLQYLIARLSSDVVQTFCKILQLVLGIGIFLFPFFDLKVPLKDLAKTLLVFVLLSLGLYFATQDIISAGVLFTNYLPKIVGCLFVGLGVFGWSTVIRLRFDDRLFLGTVFGTLMIICFDALRGVQDLRYVMAISLIWFVLVMKRSGRSLFAAHRWLGISILAVSVFVNIYNLTTTEIRWQLAHQLESTGVNPRQISAGYGRDLWAFEPECTEAALKKSTTSDELRERVQLKVPRTSEDESSPRYLIKPASVFGKTLSLTRNLRTGQENPPLQVMNYQILGLTSSVALIDTHNSDLAWCFR